MQQIVSERPRGKTTSQEADTDTSSARRLLRVLLSFSASSPTATAEELARRIGLPLSSTYRYLATLREVGLVEDNGRSGFSVGPAALRLTQAARMTNPLERRVRQHVKHLAEMSGETVVLLKRINEKAICIDGIEAAHMIRANVKIGAVVPLHLGAAPLALLAGMPEPARDQMIKYCARRYGLDPTHIAALRATIREVDQRGWALCNGGAFPDVFAVAAQIHESDGVVASIAVVAPSFRVSSADADRYRDLVIACATEITEEQLQQAGSPLQE